MAQNSRRNRRDQKSAAPPAVVRRPRPRPGATSAATAAQSVRAIAESEDLDTTYAHVRRDLIRIAVLGVLLFAAIYGSQFV